MIHIEKLIFSYPNAAFQLQIPALAIESGASVAITGPSGCGKTTLMSLVAGILVPVRGSIRIDERSINTLTDAQRRNFRISEMGMIFQDFELIEYLNVHENILLPFFINSSQTLDAHIRQRAVELAEFMNIGDKLGRAVGKLSQGEKQRVAICRALLTRPRFILADEPTGNLDPVNKQHIIEILFHQIRNTDATFLMVTHDHSLLDRFDRVVDLYDFYTGRKEVT